MESNSNNVVFFSSCPESWGGSEELWSQAAALLAEEGYRIHVFKPNIDFDHPQIEALTKVGCRITDLNDHLPSVLRRICNRLLPSLYIGTELSKRVNQLKPKLLVVSQGANFDALPYLKECPLAESPYVLISQKATEWLWVNDRDREWMKKIWQNAKKLYFVSEHNSNLTQEQFGIKMSNAEVVRNPFLTDARCPQPWSFSSQDTVKLACVGRLFPQEKGQDILLRVLADEKWRRRRLEVSFFGKGMCEQGLKDLAIYFDLNNVVFKGHISDVDSIWKEHQALVLPSRAEGLPLVLVEAMFCGRTAIVTNVGGNAEVIQDNVTGFISKTAGEEDFDEALERAWKRRDEWENIGKSAAAKICSFVPPNPAREFSEKLINIIKEESE